MWRCHQWLQQGTFLLNALAHHFHRKTEGGGAAGLKGGWGGNVRGREAETVELMSTDPPVGRPAFSYWTLLWKEEIIHLRQRRSGITCRWTDCDCVTSPAALSGPISLMQCTSLVHVHIHTHAHTHSHSHRRTDGAVLIMESASEVCVYLIVECRLYWQAVFLTIFLNLVWLELFVDATAGVFLLLTLFV